MILIFARILLTTFKKQKENHKKLNLNFNQNSDENKNVLTMIAIPTLSRHLPIESEICTFITCSRSLSVF